MRTKHFMISKRITVTAINIYLIAQCRVPIQINPSSLVRFISPENGGCHGNHKYCYEMDSIARAEIVSHIQLDEKYITLRLIAYAMVTEARDSHIDKRLKWQTIYHPVSPTKTTINYDEWWYVFIHTHTLLQI